MEAEIEQLERKEAKKAGSSDSAGPRVGKEESRWQGQAEAQALFLRSQGTKGKKGKECAGAGKGPDSDDEKFPYKENPR